LLSNTRRQNRRNTRLRGTTCLTGLESLRLCLNARSFKEILVVRAIQTNQEREEDAVMATSGNRSNEIDQQEATSSSRVTKEYVDQDDAGGPDYPGYITSAVGTTSTDPNPTTSDPNDSTSCLSSPPPRVSPVLKSKSPQERLVTKLFHFTHRNE
jgi:hypothetical protein